MIPNILGAWLFLSGLNFPPTTSVALEVGGASLRNPSSWYGRAPEIASNLGLDTSGTADWNSTIVVCVEEDALMAEYWGLFARERYFEADFDASSAAYMPAGFHIDRTVFPLDAGPYLHIESHALSVQAGVGAGVYIIRTRQGGWVPAGTRIEAPFSIDVFLKTVAPLSSGWAITAEVLWDWVTLGNGGSYFQEGGDAGMNALLVGLSYQF